ncbi:hypothetical protein CIW49_14780 [Mycolicibacterium sp. P1-18]|uniref:hypothetical protein n=1 Tax=Mycolicibacterium sp. P1-18 TaxID=2024615 RepID=UPI0011F16414|nr:hypothetical protein [Mycolicibacterium sp. P1-18]KAA0097946.1 hypothetical protein CIW49_14780 [Mycolicibacterium sp. P1-18]
MTYTGVTATSADDGRDVDASAPAAPWWRRSGRWATVVWPGAAALLVCLLWTVLESTRVGIPAPFEDAAMLFRYADNLADGWGIVWNAGQAPGATDGATDLGFVLLLAPLTLLGLSTAAAAVLVNLAAVFGIGALFGVLNAKLWRRSSALPIALGALVGGGPVDRYVLSGFSPPVLGFLLLAAFTLAALAPLAPSARGATAALVAAGAVAGIAGWWRPEAFAFGPLVVVLGLLLTRRRGRQRVLSPAAVASAAVPFAVVVAGWIALRIGYFGQLLPTSAVMKSGSLHAENILFSLQFYGSLLLPLIGALVVVASGRGRDRTWWLAGVALGAPLLWVNAALPAEFWDKVGLTAAPMIANVATVVVFVPVVVALLLRGRRDGSWLFPVALVLVSLSWIVIGTTLNWWGRMQWPLVPMLAALAATHVVDAWARTPAASAASPVRRRSVPKIVVAALVCVGLIPFHLPAGGYFESPFQSSVASAFGAVDTSGVRVATTEAGLIPLAVTGTALDTYGHNNRDIAATRGAALGRELDAFRPNVLAVHGLPPASVQLEDCSAQQQRGVTKFNDRWTQMVDEIYRAAQRQGLVLTRLSETTPCETWSLWLSADVSPQVRQAVENLTMPGTDVRVG